MSLGAAQIGFDLHHLTLRSPSPERLAGFYGTAMDMKIERVSDLEWRCAGPDRKLGIVEGPANTLARAAYTCRGKEALSEFRAHVERQDVAVTSADNAYFDDGCFAVSDPDGNEIVFGVAEPDASQFNGIAGALQHVVFASFNVEAFRSFYCDKLGFSLTDRVLHDDGSLATCFFTSNHEHHTLACFLADRQGIDHHCYEAGEWNYIRDWCDHFADQDIPLVWGPGRHGPGNNLFAFVNDPDGNWVEVSAELETVRGRPVKDWPQSERTLNLWGNGVLRS